MGMTSLVESLLVLQDLFDDDLLDSITEADLHDPEVLFTAGDIPDDIQLIEDEATAILANYGQIHQYIHNKRLSRGRFRQRCKSGGGKGAGKGNLGNQVIPHLPNVGPAASSLHAPSVQDTARWAIGPENAQTRQMSVRAGVSTDS